MSLRKVPVIATLVLVGLWAIAFTATHLPMQPNDDPLFPHVDKVAHATIYAVLTLMALATAVAWNYRWSVRLVATVILSMVGLGIFDEITQMLVAGRTAEPLDLMADTFGIVLGICLFGLVRSFRAGQALSASESS